ncbi:hypothetical protein [Estrella lausannensis]|uniref:Uncharacterized protein n=1 Tax=Estrella lausannensis TaxID=483423 RepID=A0A0H5E3E1_9BACT|nr:hypothetical protein [Estrella lausannensis]CRX37735.1 hypothetical protein ELAC_0374 [Estrella lausannensis]
MAFSINIQLLTSAANENLDHKAKGGSMISTDQIREAGESTCCPQANLPRAISTAKKNLERRIASIASVIQEEPKEVFHKIQQITVKAETDLLCAFGEEEEELVIRTACSALQTLYHTEWLFRYSALLNIASKAGTRISYASQENNFELDFEDELSFEEHERQLRQILLDVKKEIKDLDESKKMECINKAIQSIEELLIAIEVSISVLSLADIKRKIEIRINYAWDRHDLEFENESAQIEEIVNGALREIHGKSDLVDKYRLVSDARDKLEEVDIKIEKEIALKEIHLKWKDVKQTIESLDEKKAYGMSFKEEDSYADNALQDCKDVIGSIHKPHSPIGLSQVSQLFVAASGALSTLEWNKSQIYLKYGIERIERGIKFKKLKMHYDGINEAKLEQFKRFSRHLLANAEEEMVYGSVIEDPVEKKAREKTSRPPTIPFERVERVVEKSMQEIKSYQ